MFINIVQWLPEKNKYFEEVFKPHEIEVDRGNIAMEINVSSYGYWNIKKLQFLNDVVCFRLSF